MKRWHVVRIVALAVASGCWTAASAQQFGRPVLSATFNPGSTVKLQQITGDCDWSIWDASMGVGPAPVCDTTVSQTTTRFDVLGHDLGANFEANGQLLFFFGDTIGAENHYNPRWTSVSNPYQYMAGDTFAASTTRHAEDGLLLNYFVGSDPTHANTIQPIYPSGAAPAACAPGGTIAAGADDVPSGGITVNGQIYFSYATGSDVSTENLPG